MFEAAFALILTGHGATAGGPPPPLLRIEIADANPGVTTSFGIHRGRGGESGPLRIDRSIRRGEADGGRDSLSVVACPELRPLLDEAVRLPLPSPRLDNVTWIAAAAPRTTYRIEGLSRTGSGAIGRLTMTSVEGWNAGPTPLATWARAIERSFQSCLDRRGTPPPAEERSGDDD